MHAAKEYQQHTDNEIIDKRLPKITIETPKLGRTSVFEQFPPNF
jgi:hypothetical protein